MLVVPITHNTETEISAPSFVKLEVVYFKYGGFFGQKPVISSTRKEIINLARVKRIYGNEKREATHPTTCIIESKDEDDIEVVGNLDRILEKIKETR